MPLKISNSEKVKDAQLDISRRSEAVQEIISNNPGFLIRYGISIFLIILILMSLVCWVIKYPDLVAVNAKLTSINSPKSVICKSDGKLIKLYVLEGKDVLKGTILGYMESTANQPGVVALSAVLDSLSFLLTDNKVEQLQKVFPYQYDNLGELQQAYQSFTQSFITFRNYFSNGFYLKKKSMLYTDMQQQQKLHIILAQQKIIASKDLSIAQSTFDMNDSLKKQKVISDLDFRNEQSKLLVKQLSIPQINTALVNNESQQNEKQKEILELENTIAQQKSIFQQALNTFKSQVNEWKTRYLLIAPIDGKVSFATFLQENQQLQTNQIICFIQSDNIQYYAVIYIRQSNFGKVKIGQEVILRFPAYPDVEFGSVVGKIDFISKIPTDTGFMAKVTLPNGLNTNYKKQIQFKDGLLANGEIITENMRLLQRFYNNFYKSIKR
jgi:HlyD family secretion protein